MQPDGQVSSYELGRRQAAEMVRNKPIQFVWDQLEHWYLRQTVLLQAAYAEGVTDYLTDAIRDYQLRKNGRYDLL